MLQSPFMNLCCCCVTQIGWGLEINKKKLEMINRVRYGHDCFNKAATTKVNGNTKKKTLTESPFIHKFEFGGDKGYWTGNHMILQVKDCIDCLRILFKDQYNFAFLFDHSSGHAKERL
jgi:hypothetical protein